jgi:hypothetical protein
MDTGARGPIDARYPLLRTSKTLSPIDARNDEQTLTAEAVSKVRNPPNGSLGILSDPFYKQTAQLRKSPKRQFGDSSDPFYKPYPFCVAPTANGLSGSPEHFAAALYHLKMRV